MPDPLIDAQDGGEPPQDLYQFDRTVGKRVPTVDAVTEADLGFFHQHGYLVVDDLVDTSLVEAGREGLTALIDHPEFENVMYEAHKFDEIDELGELSATEQLPYIRRFASFVPYDSRLARLAEHPDLLELVGRLVDGEPERFQEMALIKPPGGREKPWHQDKAYFDVALDAPVVGVWIALDEATTENGCMHVIPGSHLEGPVVHFDRRDWQICDTDVQVDEDVTVPLSPGGALFFDGLIHHGTPPNRSNTMRRALQYHYTAADAEWLADGHEEFNSEGKDVEC